MNFPDSIRAKYRVKRTRLAPGEVEHTIPLRSGKGHVYVYGSGWYGVFLSSKKPNKTVNVLRPEFPNLIEQQLTKEVPLNC